MHALNARFCYNLDFQARTSPNDAAAAEAQGILFPMSAFLDFNHHHQNATLLKPPSENPKRLLLIISEMAKVDVITFVTLTNLISFDGLYLVGYAWLFGMCWCFQA